MTSIRQCLPGCCSDWPTPRWWWGARDATLEAVRSIAAGLRARRVSDPAGRGVRPLDADARRVGPVDRTQKEGLEADGPTRTIRTAKITKMKDGRTHLAHTAEHAVDLHRRHPGRDGAGRECGRHDDLGRHARHGRRAGRGGRRAGDRGGGGRQGISQQRDDGRVCGHGVRSYVSEPDRGRRHWKGQDAVYANRRRIRGARGKRLLRQRGELLNGPTRISTRPAGCAASICAGMKRLLVQVCGVNLGLLMRHLTGVGTPRSPGPRVGAGGGADRRAAAGGVCGASGPRSAMIGPIRRGIVRRHANTDTRFSIDNQPLLPRAARVRPRDSYCERRCSSDWIARDSSRCASS